MIESNVENNGLFGPTFLHRGEPDMNNCPCGSDRPYEECCQPIIKGEQSAPTAETLMRARYSSYVKQELDFLLESTHPDHREDYDPQSTRTWSESARWHGLEIADTVDGTEGDTTGEVEFMAHFSIRNQRQVHHERATFEKVDGKWFFVDGFFVKPQQYVREDPKVGRNDPCPCGSGKKFKKCCGRNN